MTINFVCRSSKTSKKDGLTPLELYVIINGKRRYVSLNRRIDHKLFNLRKQIVRGDDQTNNYIEAVRMKCYSLETEMLKRGCCRASVPDCGVRLSAVPPVDAMFPLPHRERTSCAARTRGCAVAFLCRARQRRMASCRQAADK